MTSRILTTILSDVPDYVTDEWLQEHALWATRGVLGILPVEPEADSPNRGQVLVRASTITEQEAEFHRSVGGFAT